MNKYDLERERDHDKDRRDWEETEHQLNKQVDQLIRDVAVEKEMTASQSIRIKELTDE